MAKHLKQRIEDPASQLADIRGRQFKAEYEHLLSYMADDDELWEWEWFAPPGAARRSYSAGWCIVRKGTPLYSLAHSYS